MSRYLISLVDCEGVPHLGKTSLWNYCIKFKYLIDEEKKLTPINHLSFMTCSKNEKVDHVKMLIRMNNRFLDNMLKDYNAHKIIMIGWNVPHDQKVFQFYGFSHTYVHFQDLLPYCRTQVKDIDNYKLVTVGEHCGMKIIKKDLHMALYDVLVLEHVLDKIGFKTKMFEIPPMEDKSVDNLCKELDDITL